MLTLLTPASRRLRALAASSVPLVVSASVRSPSSEASRAAKGTRSRRTRGSPPVILTLLGQTEGHAKGDDTYEFLVAEYCGARQVGLGRGRAVITAQIAAVGDRQPQVTDLPTETVKQHSQLRSNKYSGREKCLKPHYSVFPEGKAGGRKKGTPPLRAGLGGC